MFAKFPRLNTSIKSIILSSQHSHTSCSSCSPHSPVYFANDRNKFQLLKIFAHIVQCPQHNTHSKEIHSSHIHRMRAGASQASSKSCVSIQRLQAAASKLQNLTHSSGNEYPAQRLTGQRANRILQVTLPIQHSTEPDQRLHWAANTNVAADCASSIHCASTRHTSHRKHAAGLGLRRCERFGAAQHRTRMRQLSVHAAALDRRRVRHYRLSAGAALGLPARRTVAGRRVSGSSDEVHQKTAAAVHCVHARTGAGLQAVVAFGHIHSESVSHHDRYAGW